MHLKIGENLRELRKQRGITQEELAAYLDISFQSVSKWERGESTPDIATIMGIANFFDVTIDELAGREKTLDHAAIQDVFRQDGELQRQGKFKQAEALLRDALKFHPNHYGLLSQLALCLANENESEEAIREGIALCQRVWAECRNEKVRATTVSTLCYLYRMAGEDQNAVSVARALPHIWEGREMVWPDMLFGAQRVEILKKSVYTALCVMAEKIQTVHSQERQIPRLVTFGPPDWDSEEMLRRIGEFIRTP